MTGKRLYVLPIPADATTDAESKLNRNVSARGVVGGETAAVEPVSVEAHRRSLRGEYRGRYAGRMAAELRELFDAAGYGTVPFHGTDGRTDEDGYYALQSATVGPLDPRGDAFQGFQGALTKQGTRRSHWRAVETAPVQPEGGTDFGNDTTGHVGVPAAAGKVRWFDPVTGTRSSATVLETRTGEFGDVDVYDAMAPSFDDPVLLYDLPYAEEGKVDCRVWDDHGRSKLDDDGVVAWQRAFRADHEYHGVPVVENGLLRLRFDESGDGLSAWAWDDEAGSWSSVSLGSSDWELFDLDLVEVSPAAVRAQAEFHDTSQSPTAYFSLVMALHRGYREAQWFVPEGEQGPTPSGLVTLLDQVADGSVVDLQGENGLVARTEVRK